LESKILMGDPRLTGKEFALSGLRKSRR